MLSSVSPVTVPVITCEAARPLPDKSNSDTAPPPDRLTTPPTLSVATLFGTLVMTPPPLPITDSTPAFTTAIVCNAPPFVVTLMLPVAALLTVPPCSTPPSSTSVLAAAIFVMLVAPLSAARNVIVPPPAADTTPVLATAALSSTLPPAPVAIMPLLVTALFTCNAPPDTLQQANVDDAVLGRIDSQGAAGCLDRALGLVLQCHQPVAEFGVAADRVVDVVQRVAGHRAGDHLRCGQAIAGHVRQRHGATPGQRSPRRPHAASRCCSERC